MDIRVKICGLTENQGLRAAIAAGADLAGFVFACDSPRFLAPADAARLFDPVRGRIASVAVLVDPVDEWVHAVVETFCPDWLQVHGHESPARLAELKARFGIPVIKGLGIGTASDLAGIKAFHGSADLLLLDAKPPKGMSRPGGHGTIFDWTQIAGYTGPTPFLLAGGLRADNAGAAIALAGQVKGFAGLDVSSGVERAPGLKDPSAIAAFVSAARAAAGALQP